MYTLSMTTVVNIDLSVLTATVNGFGLIVLQVMVGQLGVKMSMNKGNKNNSELRNALLFAGLKSNLDEEKLRTKYQGVQRKILFIAPFVLLVTGLVSYYWTGAGSSLLLSYLGAAALFALNPIYIALSKESTASEAANSTV
jgi:hypothetical protein